jgi:uncharacterized protein (TIGR02145 family)
MTDKVYVCSVNPEHRFEKPTDDFWCPICDISLRPMLRPELLSPQPAPSDETVVEVFNSSITNEAEAEGFMPAPTQDSQSSQKFNAVSDSVKSSVEIKETFLKPIIDAIQIGNQVWMRDFLSSKELLDGTPIQQATTTKEWYQASQQRIPAWCYPNNEESIPGHLGILYNFYAITHPFGIAPPGWEIPLLEDVLILSEAPAGNFLNDHMKWCTNRDLHHRLAMGTFVESGQKRIFWTQTNKVMYMAHSFSYDSKSNSVDIRLSEKSSGYFVRCIKKS